MSSHIQFTGPSPDLLGTRRDGNNKNELGSIRSAIKNILNRLVTIEDNINKNTLDTIHQRITSQHESFANAMEQRVKNELEFRSNLERDRQMIYDLKNIIMNNNSNQESDNNNTDNNKTLPSFSSPPSYTSTAPTAAPLGFELIISNLYQEISLLKQSRRDDIDKMNFVETKLKATEICLLDNINQWNADQEEIRSVLSAEITARRKAQSKIQSTLSTSNINYANSSTTNQSNPINPELIAGLSSDVVKCNFKVDTLERTVKALENTIINKIDEIQTSTLNANMNMKTQIATIKAQQSHSPKPTADSVTATTTSTNPTTSPYITSVTVDDIQRRQGVIDKKVDNLKVRLESIEKVFMHATDFPLSLVNSGDKPNSHLPVQPNYEVTAVSHKSVKKAPTVSLHHTPTEPSSAKSSQLSPRQATREIGQNYDSLITPTTQCAIEPSESTSLTLAQGLLVSDRARAHVNGGGDAQEADANVRLDETIDTPGMSPHDGMREMITAVTVPAVEHESDTLNEKLVYTTDGVVGTHVVKAAGLGDVDEVQLSESPDEVQLSESPDDVDQASSTPVIAAVVERVDDLVPNEEDVKLIAISAQPLTIEEPAKEDLALPVDMELVEAAAGESVEAEGTLLEAESNSPTGEQGSEGIIVAEGDDTPSEVPVSSADSDLLVAELANLAHSAEASVANADIVEPSNSSDEAVEVTADTGLGHTDQPVEASLEPTITGEDTYAPEDGGHSPDVAPQIETEPESSLPVEGELMTKTEVATTLDVELEVDAPAVTSELADLPSADEEKDTALVNATEEADQAPPESAAHESTDVDSSPLADEAHIPVSANGELVPEIETDTADPVPATNEGSELLQDTLSSVPINGEEEAVESTAPAEGESVQDVTIAQPAHEEPQAEERDDIALTVDEAADLPSTTTEPPADGPGAIDLNNDATPEPLVAEAEHILPSTEPAETTTATDAIDVVGDNGTAPESENTLHAAAEETDEPVGGPIGTEVADGVEVQSDVDAHTLESTTAVGPHAIDLTEEELPFTGPNIIEAPAAVTDKADLKPTRDEEAATEESATADSTEDLIERTETHKIADVSSPELSAPKIVSDSTHDVIPFDTHEAPVHEASPPNDPAESPTDLDPSDAVTSVKSGDDYAEDEFESVKDAPSSALSHEGHVPPEPCVPEDSETAEPSPDEAEPTAVSSSLPSTDTSKPALPTVTSVKGGDEYADDFESIKQAVDPTTLSPTAALEQLSHSETKQEEAHLKTQTG